jgi:hypothetical protein
MSQSLSAANTRRYTTVHKIEGPGCYGFRWIVSLAVRCDGLRFRYYYHGFRWVGNEGGIHEDVRYLSPAEARELWDREFAGAHEESFEEAVAAALAR